MDAESTGASTTSATTEKTSAGAPAPETAPDAAGKTYTQADIDRIIAERLKQERKTAADKAKEAAALAAGEHQTVAEQRAARIAELEAELAARDHRALAAKVATAAGLPADLADRLRGADEAALTADAAALAALLPKAAPAAGAATNPPKAGTPPDPEDELNAYYTRTRGRSGPGGAIRL